MRFESALLSALLEFSDTLLIRPSMVAASMNIEFVPVEPEANALIPRTTPADAPEP